MELLYSNIPPLSTEEGHTNILDMINEQIALADRVDIAVGYVSKNALIELDSLVKKKCCQANNAYYRDVLY